MKKEPPMTQAAEKACPREPTAEMVEAGQRIRGLYRWRIEAIWQAMFDAAPPAPAVPVEVAEMIKRLRVDAEWHRGCSRGDMARNADQAADMLAALSQQPARGGVDAYERAARVADYAVERAERDWRDPAKQDAVKQVGAEIAEAIRSYKPGGAFAAPRQDEEKTHG